MLGLKGRHQWSDDSCTRIKGPGVASTEAVTEGEEDQMARLSIYREQLTKEGTETGRLLMKKKKSTGPRTDPCGTPRQPRKERLL